VREGGPAVDNTRQAYTAPALWTDRVHVRARLMRTVEFAREDVGKVFRLRPGRCSPNACCST